MKPASLPAVGLLAILSIACYAQPASSVLKDVSTQPVRTIDTSDEDFSDLQFLKETLKDNRVVLLGEQSHGEGATFEAKVRLIKFLHQQMGYDVLAFESGLYDNYKAFGSIMDTLFRDSPLKESIFRIWSDTKEFEPLLKYIHQKKTTTRPLIVSGFDAQTDNIFNNNFIDDIMRSTGALSEAEIALMQEVIEGGAEMIVANDGDSVKFFSLCNNLRTKLEASRSFQTDIQTKVLHQSLISWIEMIKWEIDILHEKETKVQNPRDLQMARNLIFLSKLYPDKKIIGWGASYHFANDITQYRNTDLTREYARRMDSVQKSEEPFDLDKSLDGAVPMGLILKQHFGSKLYSVAFSSYEGDFGMLGLKKTSLQSVTPPIGSIEQELVQRNCNVCFVDYRNVKSDAYFYSSALGNLPIFAPWHKVFDGLFFIKQSFAPSFPANASVTTAAPKNELPSQTAGNSGVKRLVDKTNGAGVAYGNISLLNTSKGVAANADGEFIFNVSSASSTEKIVFSSMGYKTDTLTVAQYEKASKIELLPAAKLLDAVEVRSKPLRAREIIKLAEKRISENYYQSANQQEFFYRVKTYQEDSVVFNEEASVLVYNPQGYKSSKNASKNFKGQILQYKDRQGENEDAWSGTGSLWLIYTHDLVLDKANVLHRPAHYDLTLNGVTIYENKLVYDISFDCKRPGAYTTGFGYPAPQSAVGKIYIDTETYAVLKFESLIRRQAYKSKRRPNLVADPYGHHLVQTYKEYNGKYFLNYSKQTHFSNWTNTLNSKSNRSLDIRELLSTSIVTSMPSPLTISLSNIKSLKPQEQPDFWINHHLKIEDDVNENYKMLGLKK